MPDRLRAGIEALSGMDMSAVRLHANSAKPAQLNALAYAQGNDIHLGPGQERHIAHEAWHVVQQRQGRVRPTLQMKGLAINDDPELEREADAMGAKAQQMKQGDRTGLPPPAPTGGGPAPIQCVWERFEGPNAWVYRPLSGYYLNVETGDQFYPETGILDNPREPFGLQELDEEEAEALQREIDGPHSTGLWVNTDNDMLFDPEERVLSFVDRPEIRVPVDARENYETLKEIDRDGGDVAEELLEAREEVEGTPKTGPSKQMTRGARIGFEFQELRSKVKVLEAQPEPQQAEDDDSGFSIGRDEEAQDEYERALAARPIAVATALYGKENRWYVVGDGDNLEFVTLPFESLVDLRETMAEVQAVASLLGEAKPGSAYRLGETVVQIVRPGRDAQPQANPDIPLDTLHNFIEDLAEDKAGSGFMSDALFGVSTGFWDAKKTAEEMTMVSQASGAIQGLADDDMRRIFGVADDDLAEGRIATIKGMLQLMANAAIHQAFFPTRLPKDQPILLKAHMGRTWKSLVDAKVIKVTSRTHARVVDLLCGLPDLADDEDLIENIVGLVMSGTDPVWGSTKEPDSLDEEQPGRKQVLIELRRVPVLPIAEWTEFAESIYRYFIADAAQRFD